MQDYGRIFHMAIPTPQTTISMLTSITGRKDKDYNGLFQQEDNIWDFHSKKDQQSELLINIYGHHFNAFTYIHNGLCSIKSQVLQFKE